ncbi:MAG: hypothetical protein WDO70_08440 [Alphaproteobacteria bacterium]
MARHSSGLFPEAQSLPLKVEGERHQDWNKLALIAAGGGQKADKALATIMHVHEDHSLPEPIRQEAAVVVSAVFAHKGVRAHTDNFNAALQNKNPAIKNLARSLKSSLPNLKGILLHDHEGDPAQRARLVALETVNLWEEARHVRLTELAVTAVRGGPSGIEALKVFDVLYRLPEQFPPEMLAEINTARFAVEACTGNLASAEFFRDAKERGGSNVRALTASLHRALPQILPEEAPPPLPGIRRSATPLQTFAVRPTSRHPAKLEKKPSQPIPRPTPKVGPKRTPTRPGGFAATKLPVPKPK